jgi:predicted lipoprotein with Yx(FWY)xxD motif
MTRNLTVFALTAAALALFATGCGSSDSSSSGGPYGGESSSSGGAYGGGATTKPASTQPSEGAATVTVGTVPKLGKVVVDSEGFTLYDFHKDKGTTSSCYGGCESLWPPMTTTGKPQAGGSVSASMLGTTKRKDGTTQVTFAGHPLYTYTADSKPGEANGNDFSSFGAQWYALLPNGEEAGD